MSDEQHAPESPDEPPRHLPSRRATAVTAVVAGGLDGWLTARSGSGIGTVLLAALLMAVFVYAGMRWITARRRAHRPPVMQPTQRDPSAPPPPGGWANPTASQRRVGRARRMLGDAISRGGSARDRRPGRR